jgi:sterol desaturase/sphingolipid hydroxylase (fatty acid hydroxylase superfamily)
MTHWVLAVTGVILLAELIAGRHRGVYNRNDLFVNGICIFVGAVVRPLGAVVVSLLIGWMLPAGKGALSGMPFVPALIGIILVAELFNYGVHRFSHEWKGSRLGDWLWRMHRTHHTAHYVNVLLNFRISLFWGLVAGLTWAFSLALYLGLAKPAGVAIAIFSFWGIVTHSDFRWDIPLRRTRLRSLLRAIEHVVITPGTHHSHHGFGKDGGNYRNFGVLLAIYDWMFGTLYIPEGRPHRYGLPGTDPHWVDDAFSPLNLSAVLPKAKSASEDVAAQS